MRVTFSINNIDAMMPSRFAITLLFPLVLFLLGCESPQDLSTTQAAIDLHELVEVKSEEEGLSIFVPKFLELQESNEDKVVLSFASVDGSSAYFVYITKLVSQTTMKMSNDKEYNDIVAAGFIDKMGGDLAVIEKAMQNPVLESLSILELNPTIMVNGKYCLRRIGQWLDLRNNGTPLEGQQTKSYHYVTWHNDAKYAVNIEYCGNDKGFTDLVGLFSAIGGSLRFD